MPRQPVRGGFGAGTCRDVPFRGRRCGRHFRLGGMLCARRHPRQDLRNRTVGCADSRLGCCCKIARIRAHRRLEFLHCAKPWACRICGMVRGKGVGHVRCSDCGCGVSCPTFLQAVLGSGRSVGARSDAVSSGCGSTCLCVPHVTAFTVDDGQHDSTIAMVYFSCPFGCACSNKDDTANTSEGIVVR